MYSRVIWSAEKKLSAWSSSILACSFPPLVHMQKRSKQTRQQVEPNETKIDAQKNIRKTIRINRSIYRKKKLKLSNDIKTMDFSWDSFSFHFHFSNVHVDQDVQSLHSSLWLTFLMALSDAFDWRSLLDVECPRSCLHRHSPIEHDACRQVLDYSEDKFRWKDRNYTSVVHLTNRCPMKFIFDDETEFCTVPGMHSFPSSNW